MVVFRVDILPQAAVLAGRQSPTWIGPRETAAQRKYKKWKIVGTNSRKYFKTNDIAFFGMQIARILRVTLHNLSTKMSKNCACFAKRS